MRKPVNNETNLINEIWSNSNKQLNERRDSVAEPTVTDIMGTRPEYDFDGEKQKEAQKKYQNTFGANWAELTADALKKQKIKNIQDKPVTSQEMGPEVDIEDDNDTDGVVVVDMRPAFTGKPEKSAPEMPRWSESPHGYEPVTPEQAEKTAQEMESQNKFIGKTMYPFGDVQKRAATKVGPPVPTQAERNQQAKDATQKLVDTATKILNPQIKKEVTKISQQEQPMDTAVEKYKKQLADRVSPSVVKTSEIESMFNLTPQSPGDMGPRLNIPMGKPVEAKAEKVEAGIEKTISRANKLAAEEKAATPEERAKVVAGAERLSKETGKEITPYTVAHEKATRESLKTNLEKLNQLEKSNQQKLIQQQQSLQQTPKPQSKPTSRTPDGGPGSGRDTSNIVPGSQMWGELSSSERQKIRDRYSKGEGPSISIR
jgi:hypothetical protein